MQVFYQLLALVGAILIVLVLYRTIKARPDQFNRELMNKSFTTMGILALLLIGFVALLILLVRPG